jgi:2-polyprenyl-3-methyl-5-hydroxy-6-metoxy-1,4-benzoquinol methylase
MLVKEHPRVKPEWSPVGRSQTVQTYFVPRDVDPPSRDYWDETTDPDGVTRQRFTEEERRNYLENVAEELTFIRQELEPGWMIDYGCGPGWLLEETREAGWKVVGVEVSKNAHQQLEESGILYRAFLPCALHEVDLITCLQVIEHLPNPMNHLSRIRKALRPGGWFIVSTPDFHSPCAVRFGRNYRMLHDPTHCSLFTRESLYRMLTDFGFVVEDIRYPFPDRYATEDTWRRWNDITKMSPPWPGNWMTFYCKRRRA